MQLRDDTDCPFSGVCEYQLQCVRSADSVQPYPPCAHTSWGPGDSAGKYALTPLHGDAAVLEAPEDGVVEVRLKTSPGLRFTARLKSVNCDEDELTTYLLQRIVNNIVIFLIKVKSRETLNTCFSVFQILTYWINSLLGDFCSVQKSKFIVICRICC